MDINPICKKTFKCDNCTTCTDDGGYNRNSRHWTSFKILEIYQSKHHQGIRLENTTNTINNTYDVESVYMTYIRALASYEYECDINNPPSEQTCLYGQYYGDFMELRTYAIWKNDYNEIQLIDTKPYNLKIFASDRKGDRRIYTEYASMIKASKLN